MNLRLSNSEIWQQTRRDQKNKVNKCKRLGMTARIVPFKSNINTFISIYQETMNRVGALDFYSFDQEYFADLVAALEDKLHLCLVELGGHVLSAGIYSEYCGIVQAILGGTRTESLKLSPTSLETDYVRYWAKERGNSFLHLGGGLGGSCDSLFYFKAGFSQLRHKFLTVRLIIDQKKYRSLVGLRAESLNMQEQELLKSQFFPAYRALGL